MCEDVQMSGVWDYQDFIFEGCYPPGCHTRTPLTCVFSTTMADRVIWPRHPEETQAVLIETVQPNWRHAESAPTSRQALDIRRRPHAMRRNTRVEGQRAIQQKLSSRCQCSDFDLGWRSRSAPTSDRFDERTGGHDHARTHEDHLPEPQGEWGRKPIWQPGWPPEEGPCRNGEPGNQIPADLVVDGTSNDDENDDCDTGQGNRDGCVIGPPPPIEVENWIEGHGHEGEPSQELPPNSPSDDVESNEQHGESHELVPEKTLLEDEPHAQAGCDQ